MIHEETFAGLYIFRTLGGAQVRPSFWVELKQCKILGQDDNKSTVIRSKTFPGLGIDLWKDNARLKCTMRRPYSTHLSYEKTMKMSFVKFLGPAKVPC